MFSHNVTTHMEDRLGENLELEHFSGKLGTALQPGHLRDCWPTDSEAVGETL